MEQVHELDQPNWSLRLNGKEVERGTYQEMYNLAHSPEYVNRFVEIAYGKQTRETALATAIQNPNTINRER